MKCWYLAGGLALVLSVFMGDLAAADTGVAATPERCTAYIDGARFPELIPADYAWDQLWNRVASLQRGSAEWQRLARELDVDDATLGAIAAQARNRRARVAALRAAVGGADGTELADASLAARDELARSIPTGAFDSIHTWVEGRRRQLTYQFARPGVLRVADVTGAIKCHMSVGADEPHLIPESYQWETYFLFKAGVANQRLQGADFAPDFLLLQQEYHLKMPLDDVRTVLKVALDTTARVDARRARVHADDHAAMRRDLARIVYEARGELLRALPKSSWSAVLRDAERVRKSTIFGFPPN